MRHGKRLPTVRAVLVGTSFVLAASLAAFGQQGAPFGGDGRTEDIGSAGLGRGAVTQDAAAYKQGLVSQIGGAQQVTLTAGNGIYTVFIDDTQFGTCGMWTAQTAALHPTGAGNDVIYASGNPGTSYTTLRSYDTGTFYVTGSPSCGTSLCGLTTPTITPVMSGATTVGYDFQWTFADAGNTIRFTQQLVVEGPVDGTETVDDTVIRETHVVENLGPGTFNYGLRKMWDWEISGPGVFDDGPMFGDCLVPQDACDQSMNMTPDGSMDGMYPQSYVINEDPVNIVCGGIITGSCTGTPVYLVAGTVAPPSVLSPAPTAPEVLQFNSWPSMYNNCWQPALVNNSTCAGGDTAIGYFYGLTMASALAIGPGGVAEFTQYVVAGEDACPPIIVPPGVDLDIKPGSCPNSWNRGSNGVLPVALTGSETFDVTEIDLSTVMITRADGMGGAAYPHEGPPGPHSTYEDTATPFPGELCDCHEMLGDGFLDLNLKFKTQEVVDALDMNDFMPGALVELVVSGLLLDATEFSASDCVRLVPPGTPPGQVFVTANLPGAWVDVAPLDETLDGGGFTGFERTFPLGTIVMLGAPDSHLGRAFIGWRINGGPLVTECEIPIVPLGDVTWVELVFDDPRAPIIHPADRVGPLG
ncbi:MAG: hypothetical protein ACYTG1_06855 [Planctomycetota bacterium]|jgi:hypothetical protein